MFSPHRQPTFGHPADRPYDRADGYEQYLWAQADRGRDESSPAPGGSAHEVPHPEGSKLPSE